ncbi:hypothetical protein CW751_02970 [Brumimicrobium salinarum]|uniref:PKD domain-containing protein n=1 Tax=Brumimicrobium salinarum TaxID=2058658 RepID=A0A2I0R7C2_9FLAO|nr:gliding motility-associated C-terminal domain-containing protein [Brumimicrobium salinarum]PKR82310.1 hypothetical protein CW751_02970 [Brumimicrobium salinarum]
MGNGTFSSTPSGLDLTTSNGQIDLGSSSVGTYDVFYAFTENGCDYQDSITIELLEIPELILEDSIDLCLGESWTPNASGDFDSYSWSSGLTQGVDTLGQLGNETFYVTGVSANGCEVLDSVVVSTFEQPNVSFTADPTEGLPPLNVTYTNTSDGVADTYTWDYGDGFDENTGNNTSHIFESQGIYFTNLIGSTIEGCFDTATVQINVLFPDMIYEIPNIFTPNGDNENDLFKLINPSNIEALEIIILNRWGNLVFESNDVLFEWNGKINNTDAECTTGTYFYKANLTNLSGENVEVHGFVQLARD